MLFQTNFTGMKKISTLFKKDPNDLSRVINEINPENEWVFDEGVKATRKFDGAACAIVNGQLYKRYDVKKGKSVPDGAIPCQEPDAITGHWPHWLKCDENKPEDKYFIEGLDMVRYHKLQSSIPDGTYELVGPKVQGNPERFDSQYLVRHGEHVIHLLSFDWDTIKIYLENENVEGIVFHHPDGRMCKIRKSDFGIKR
jgi:hypothetical protein